MFETNTIMGTGATKKARYEPIERRQSNRRNAVVDRRTEARAEEEKSDRRNKTERRKK